MDVNALEENNLNPLFVQTNQAEYLWESVIDVLDNYFPIAYENPIRKMENGDSVVFTEGRIDTEPVIAAGLLEPWRKNSVDCSQRLDASLQTIRRYAVVRIVPDGNGFLVHLAVYNELENLSQPMSAAATEANLLFTDSLDQIGYATPQNENKNGWIPDGRNTELEQYLLQEIAWRVNNPPSILNETSSSLVP